MQRYKGLGEMNYEELQETTMNVENRLLKRVSIEDAEQANRTFDMLMGSEVAPRKAFIQETPNTPPLMYKYFSSPIEPQAERDLQYCLS